MKSILPVVLGLLISTTLFAKENRDVAQANAGSRKAGTQCGLPENWEDVGDQTVILDFSNPTKPNRIKAMLKIAKTQLIQTAQFNAKAMGFDTTVKNAVQAVDYLRANSEGEEVYVYKVDYKGKSFAAVTHFPGGNQYGLIFPWGSSKPVAMIGDGEIQCSK